MDATVVWLDGSAAGGTSRTPNDGSAAGGTSRTPNDGSAIPTTLQTWASARGLRLQAPSEGGRHAIPVDLTVSRRVEESLHVARELLTQHDADGAERALAHADALLRAHPELPQAAWLLAEVERGFATRFERLEPIDAARAQRHWRAAAALDGGRASGVGEPTATSEQAVPFTVETTGDAEDVRLDGKPLSRHDTQAGLHQLVARASGEVVFAQWVTIASGAVLHVVFPTPEPCSRAEMTGDLAHARCPSWIAVRHGEPAGTFLVRTCVQSVCGAEIAVRALPMIDGDGHRPRSHGLPAWAAWTLTGAGVVVVGVVAGIIGYVVANPTQLTVFKTTAPQ